MNGTWLAKTEIPADRSDYGAFVTILAEKAENDLHEIIEGCAVAKDNPPGSERRSGRLLSSFMDEARAEDLASSRSQHGLRPWTPSRPRPISFGRWPNCRRSACPDRWTAAVDTDAKKSDQHILSISQSGLGLPDRDYYSDAKFKTKLAAYHAHIERMLTLAKIGDAKQVLPTLWPWNHGVPTPVVQGGEPRR